MLVRSALQSASGYVPSLLARAVPPAPSLLQVARNLHRVAIPAIILFASCNTPVAEAGLLAAGLTYVGMNVAGGAIFAVGVVTAPVGGGALMAVGLGTVTAAPYVAGALLPTPTP